MPKKYYWDFFFNARVPQGWVILSHLSSPTLNLVRLKNPKVLGLLGVQRRHRARGEQRAAKRSEKALRTLPAEGRPASQLRSNQGAADLPFPGCVLDAMGAALSWGNSKTLTRNDGSTSSAGVEQGFLSRDRSVLRDTGHLVFPKQGQEDTASPGGQWL